jgi:hypothetical protein
MMNRERIEDLGRIAERLDEILEKLDALEGFIKAIRPVEFNDDLDEISTRVAIISADLSDAWNIARWGDDEECLHF